MCGCVFTIKLIIIQCLLLSQFIVKLVSGQYSQYWEVMISLVCDNVTHTYIHTYNTLVLNITTIIIVSIISY